MEVREYAAQDAVGLAALIRSGEVSAAETADAARRALDETAALNAVVGEPFAPLEHDPAGPLGGVPFGLKDLVPHAAGLPTQLGSRLLGEGLRPPADSNLMGRFRAAGLATICRTSSPEFGMCVTTEPVATGATRNPWDTTRSSGGSSGGAAALVAARALPLAHASDGGGSIRIPAAWCGVVGLKPSRGRMPTGPIVGEALAGLPTELVCSRTVRDTAAALDATHGPSVGEKYEIAGPARPYADEVGAAPGRLRVAFTTEAWSGTAVDAACVAAVERTVRALADLGHAVDPGSPSVDTESLHRANVAIWCATTAQWVDVFAHVLGTPAGPDTLERVTLAVVEHGRRVTASEYISATNDYNAACRSVGAFFQGVDLLVTPTMAGPALPLGELDMDAAGVDADAWTRRLFDEVAPFTAVFNVTGQPAISLPLGETADGLPIGVQLVGRFGDEATLLRVAAQLEQALPWADRAPRVVAGG